MNIFKNSAFPFRLGLALCIVGLAYLLYISSCVPPKPTEEKEIIEISELEDKYRTGFYWQKGNMEPGIKSTEWDNALSTVNYFLLNNISLNQDNSEYFSTLRECNCSFSLELLSENKEARAHYRVSVVNNIDTTYLQLKIEDVFRAKGIYMPNMNHLVIIKPL